ncbi:MAG: septation regulator SpoVG [Clostridia bacterium]|nr:septation regulator SpoVG [Clostridia bacterium]MBO7156700.1 septation regulator SpoVG [Clostridia bacterium]
MQITDVRIKLINQDEKKLRAVASVIIDGAFVVHDIKVIEGSEGCFIVMPSRKAPDGTYRDIAHPLKTEVREYMRDKILESYEAALKESN